MVTSHEMREFALECLRWSDETANASQRDIMVRLAKTWMNVASLGPPGCAAASVARQHR